MTSNVCMVVVIVTTDQKSWNFSPRPRPRTPLAGFEAPRGQGHVLEDSISDFWSCLALESIGAGPPSAVLIIFGLSR